MAEDIKNEAANLFAPLHFTT